MKKKVTIPGTQDSVIVDVPEGASREEIISAAEKVYLGQMAKQSAALTDEMRWQNRGRAVAAGTATGLGAPGDVLTFLNEAASKAVLPGPLQGAGAPASFLSEMRPSEAITTGFNMAGIPTDYDQNDMSARIVDYTMQGLTAGGPARLLGARGAKQAAGLLSREVAENTVAGTGAAVGERVSDSPYAPMIGQVSPILGWKALNAGTRLVARGPSGAPMQERITRLEDAGVPATVGTTSGNPALQVLEKGAALSPGGYMVARSKGREIQEGFKESVEALAGGRNIAPLEAGLKIRGGLFGKNGWFNRTISTRNQLYSNFDSYVKPDTAVPASNTYQFLSTANKGVRGAQGLSKRVFIDKGLEEDAQAFFADIHANGGSIPYEALKKLRTAVFDKLDDPDLLRGQQQQQYADLGKALTADMKEAARLAGPEAEKALKAANRYNALRAERIENYISDINKVTGGEDVWRIALGDNPTSSTKLFAIKHSLDADQWEFVRQTTLNRMGRARPGVSTLEDSFSSESFLTNYMRMAQNDPRVLDALFGSVKSPYRKSLDTIVRAMGDIRKSSEILANPSKTAGTGMIASTVFAGSGGAILGALGLGAGVGSGFMLGAIAGTAATGGIEWLLTRQATAQWLADSTKLPISALPSHLNRLGAIAANNPEIKDDVLELQQYLRGTLGVGMSNRPSTGQAR